jgi:drug/metabolite transporter (DMT)-like permease
MVVAAIILNEQITFVSVLGGAVILVGIWLVNRPGQRTNDE